MKLVSGPITISRFEATPGKFDVQYRENGYYIPEKSLSSLSREDSLEEFRRLSIEAIDQHFSHMSGMEVKG